MAKEYLYRGRTVEDLKKLSLEEFVTLLPSRARRSLKRGLSDDQKTLLKDIRANASVKTHVRDLVILPEMVGKKISVYNGKEFVSFDVIPQMIGFRLGDFAITIKEVKHSSPGMGATRSSKFVPLK
ncbi:MAG: 30S ribosomal protein S19 [Candidatus Aenigmatarchaeota archaeon]|nr:MAG: 30S ribosomal protein S19 [Candidatus Aenigmarchaeota archaeon]